MMIHNETIDNILSRRTIRKYTDEKLTSEEIDTLLNCAMWAPSARNGQPCHVRVVQNKVFLDEMNTDMKNLVGWDTPAYTNWNINPFYQTAPAVIFIYGVGKNYMDAGIMVENITVAAKSMGLDSCIIGSIGALLDAPQGQKWKSRLDVPEDYQFLISVAVGHGDETPEPKERIKSQFKVIDNE